MEKRKPTTPEPKASSTWERLEDFVREHVQRFIQALLEEEVTELLGRTKSARREAVDAAPGYRNGYSKPRRLTLTSGTITVRRPRVRDLNERFVSRVLPLFKRQTKEVGELLPQLYLHGLALGDFELALRGLLGESAPLSPASLLRLKTQWQLAYETWKTRRLDDLEVVYLWADGLYVKAGLEDTKAALLVMIGALSNGQKVVLAVESGRRESKESWGMMLRDLRKRGLKPWRCTIADGQLGLWAALGEQYPQLAEQRCWNHRLTNVLDAMPKKHQAEARTFLCAMPYAETQTEYEALRADFTHRYRKLAPKAVERLADDWERLVTFYHFPREHWPHLRTSNVVESPFAVVRSRTTAAKRFKKVENATALIWKMLQVAESTFRRLKGAELLPAVYAGVQYIDGMHRTPKAPPRLAHHYTEAGLTAQAIPHWQRAGQHAVERSANVEAIAHLTKGLELLKAWPDAPERAQQELDLHTTLGPALMAAKGYAAPEVEQAYARARELCQQVGESPRLLQVLLGLETFYYVRAELQTARELGEQSLSLAQRLQEPARLLRAHYALGSALFNLGEFASAREHLEQGMALYDPQKHRSRAVQNPGVACLSYAALVLWSLGYPDQALERSHEALTLAQELSHPFSLAVALNWTAWLHQYRREAQLAQERAEAEIALSSEQGFSFWLGFGTIFKGWALAEQGQREEGIAQIRQGLATYGATGAETGRPHFLALLTEAYGKGGQTEEGFSMLAEALAPVNKNEDRYYEAELYRLKGELTLQAKEGTQPGAEEAAEACFLKAIEVARKQRAKSWELRAAMSLSGLWQQQGKKEEARQLLAEIYGWFTEGFDTKDLQDAKALLEELA